jgi:hypothetical protein
MNNHSDEVLHILKTKHPTNDNPPPDPEYLISSTWLKRLMAMQTGNMGVELAGMAVFCREVKDMELLAEVEAVSQDLFKISRRLLIATATPPEQFPPPNVA